MVGQPDDPRFAAGLFFTGRTWPKPAGDEILISYLSGEDWELSGLWRKTTCKSTGGLKSWFIVCFPYAFHMLSIWFCSQMLGPQPPGLPSTIRQDLLRPTWLRRKELQRGLLG